MLNFLSGEGSGSGVGQEWVGEVEGQERFLLMLCLFDGGGKAGSFPGNGIQPHQEHTKC